jgi:hypothetical protein
MSRRIFCIFRTFPVSKLYWAKRRIIWSNDYFVNLASTLVLVPIKVLHTNTSMIEIMSKKSSICISKCQRWSSGAPRNRPLNWAPGILKREQFQVYNLILRFWLQFVVKIFLYVYEFLGVKKYLQMARDLQCRTYLYKYLKFYGENYVKFVQMLHSYKSHGWIFVICKWDWKVSP